MKRHILALLTIGLITLSLSACGNPCNGMSQGDGELCAENYDY